MPTAKNADKGSKSDKRDKEAAVVDVAGDAFWSDFVQVRRRFLRSVNLERDFYSESPLAGYVPTAGALYTFRTCGESQRKCVLTI